MRRGISLLEIVIVVGLCLLIAALLLPAIGMDRSMARRTNCANNGRQVVLAMHTYQNEYDQRWPVRLTSPDGSRAKPGMLVDDRLTTVATLEWMAVYSGGDLINKVLNCPSATTRSKLPVPDPNIGTGSGLDHSAWATAAMSDHPQYTYDWTAPEKASSTRAVLSCRPLNGQVTMHKKTAAAVYADGHVMMLSTSDPGTGRRTVALDGSPYLNAHLNKEGANDDLFGDDGTPSLPGAGSPTRAWLR